MRILLTLLSCSAVILNSIGSTSQSERSPDGAHRPETSEEPAERTVRVRSRSPTLRQTFPTVLGFRYEDLELIRLSPYLSSNRTFELRKYVFPPDKPIRLRRSNLGQRALPTGERIVLSTPDGDVCAILDKTASKHTILHPICTLAPGKQNRAKINMNTGEVKEMTKEETAACPVSTRDLVANMYAVTRLSPPPSPSASSSTPAGTPLPGKSGSPALSKIFSILLGFRFEDLASIRLAPHNYPNQIFELRLYNFPPDASIGFRTKNHALTPLPTGDQIVLSTSNGEGHAILCKSAYNRTCIRPVLTSILGILERVKINLRSGEIGIMTKKEIAECPGSAGEIITKSYRVYRV